MKRNDRRVRVQVFSGSTSHYRQYDLSWRRLIAYGIVFSLGLLLLITGAFLLFSSISKDIGLKSLVLDNSKLDRSFERTTETVSPNMASLAQENTNNFTKAGLVVSMDENKTDEPLIDPDEEFYLSYSDSATEDSLGISSLLDELEMQLDEAMRVHEKIDEKYDSKESLKNLPSIIPLQNGEWRISDLFGKRKDPLVKRTRHHNGMDIAAPKGTPVYAPAAGVVEVAQYKYRINRGYGRVVRINHGKGIKSLYGHLHKIFVKPGQKVNRWDIIGLVGTTGRSTGPHLHYEIYENDKAIDPMNYILQ